MNWPANFARKSAIAGLVVWLAILFITTSDAHETDLINKVLLFGVFAIVPLGLSVVPPEREGQQQLLYRIAVLLQPPGALVTLVSLMVDQGITSASLAGVWFMIDLLIAAYGAMRFLARGLHPIEESCIDAGLVYLPVAGFGLVAARLGTQPFGFGDTILLLTGVHFHFAAFAAPMITGLTGRFLASRKHPQVVFKLAAAGIIGGIPLVGLGITFTPPLALIGAGLITLGLLLLAILTIGWVLPELSSTLQKLLLVVSALSSCTAMVLACLYAYSIVARIVIITIPKMAMTHGLLNAFGFSACALLAWSLVGPKPELTEPGAKRLLKHS